MASSSNKQRPDGVPEENVYTSIHWMVILSYIAAVFATFLLISNSS